MPKKNAELCMHGPENTFILESPLGELELICCPKGIHKLNTLLDCDANFSPKSSAKVAIRNQLYDDNGYTYKSALDCVDWLNTYFHKLDNLVSAKKPTICHLVKQIPRGNKSQESFTDKVWKTLAADVAVGQTVSYGELASMSGSAVTSSRAVGQAMRNNPVGIIVPCHRVVLSSGRMGNYSGGQKNSVKAWLLRHEGSSND